MTASVFWSRAEPQAGVIAQSFRDAYVSAGTDVERARVSGAADDWWQACGVVDAHGGQLTPLAVAAMAVRAGEVHDVEGLVVSGLVDNIGQAQAEAATEAAEQGWGEWATEKALAAKDVAAEKAQAAKDAAAVAYETVTNVPGKVYNAATQTWEDVQKLPSQVKGELKSLTDPEPEKVLWPLAVAIVGVAGALAYIISGRR